MTANHEYDEQYYVANGQLADRPALRWYVRLVRRYLGDGPVLDVGCGTGHLLKRLSAQSWQADGLEVSEFSAAAARETSPRSEVYVDAQSLPSGRYGRFTAIHVVEHLNDSTLRALLGELRRSAAPGARYLVVTPDSGGLAERLHKHGWNAYRDPTHINLKTHEEWRAFFLAEDFEIVNEGADGMWNVPYSNMPKLLDAIRYAIPMALQFLAGRLFVRPGRGESSVFVLR